MTMHAGRIPVSVGTVKELVRAQFPRWRDLNDDDPAASEPFGADLAAPQARTFRTALAPRRSR